MKRISTFLVVITLFSCNFAKPKENPYASQDSIQKYTIKN